MKRILLFSVIALTIGMTQATPVDPTAAANIARNFALSSTSHGRFKAPAKTDVQLVRSVYGSHSTTQAVYYIFNTSDSYYIVSGDDRARDVLAHGDAPLDINNMPENMKFWLSSYQEQLDYLLSHPELKVNAGRRAPAQTIDNVAPLISALWDQSAPYNYECPEVNGNRSVTGCAATALAMVFHYWKYPTELTPSVPAYTTSTYSLRLSELPPTTFDWDNMLNSYRGNYTQQQASAVAHLMRYIGQSERMDYCPEGSGTGSQDILRTVKLFDYDQSATVLNKTSWWGFENYSDEEWGNLIQEELDNERPIVMCAYTQDPEGISGHAFNIDGYDATDDTYHINWGWSGSGNAYYALNAFGYNGMVFNIMQQIVTGVEPKITEPTLKTGLSTINLRTYEDSTAYYAVKVRGALLTDDIILKLDDEDDVFSIDRQRITGADINRNNIVELTYSPKVAGTNNATITLSSSGAADKVIHIKGTCVLEIYTPSSLEVSKAEDDGYTIHWQDNTPKRNVSSYQLNIVPIPFYESRMIETFDKNGYDGVSTNDYSSKLDEVTEVPGWTGSKVYRSGTDLILGTSKSKGWLETPALDMLYNQNKVTVQVSSKSSGTTPSAPLIISCGDSDTIITVSNNDSTYCVMLDCPASDKAKVRFSSATGRRVVISDVNILAGDNYSPVNENKITSIEGITNTSWQLRDHSPGYYALRVQTLYTNGELSQWTPWTHFVIDWSIYDANHDNEINISDINQVINAIVMDLSTPSSLKVNDINRDGEISISDLNVLIDKILADN